MGSNVGRRYAQALLQALKNADAIEHAERDLTAMRSLLASLPGLGRILAHPGIKAERKRALLDGALSGLDCLPESRRLMWLLVEARAVKALGDIAGAYRLLKDRKLGMTTVEVTTAAAIPDPERAAWESALTGAAGTPVRIDFRTDSSLIGGAVATIGSVSYDGSVRGSLERIRQSLLGD